ncbi:MAG: 12-oxophytodienoate reductase, partial [Kordiimonadaceae bacterium]|nr:12-oxophytodienoate reductase [Kordiimonadaceae bacterium]
QMCIRDRDYKARLAHTVEELQQFITPLAEAGVDIFHCSTRRFWEPEFEGSDLNLAGWVKKITGLPTITVGSVGLDADFTVEGQADFCEAKPASLDKLAIRLSNREFDLAAVGRALIANPDWANKVRSESTHDLQPYTADMLTKLA